MLTYCQTASGTAQNSKHVICAQSYETLELDTIWQKAGLRSLNEMVAATSATRVWKSKKWMDPLGCLLFPPQISSMNMPTRSENSTKAKIPVPGFGVLAANLLARAWNEASPL